MIEVNEEKWAKNNRHLENLKSLDFAKSLVGKRCRLISVRDGHEFRGLVQSLFWDEDSNEHVFDVLGDKDSEESGYLSVWEIDYYESLEK